MKSEKSVPRFFLQLALPQHQKILSWNLLQSFGFKIQSPAQCTENTDNVKMQHRKPPNFLSFKELFLNFIFILIFWITSASEESVQSYHCLLVNFLNLTETALLLLGIPLLYPIISDY